jgi:hypothetical protein
VHEDRNVGIMLLRDEESGEFKSWLLPKLDTMFVGPVRSDYSVTLLTLG